jgi:hypothetical protein
MTFKSSDVNLLPPSDFKDLLVSILKFEESSDRFRLQLSPMQTSLSQAEQHTSLQLSVAQQILEEANRLLHKHDDLERHYGWALAGDFDHVGRVLGTGREERGREARQWMIDVCGRFVSARVGLEELRLTLRRLIDSLDVV